MIHCFFLISRHGRSRLTKWYSHNLSQNEKQRFLKEVTHALFVGQPISHYPKAEDVQLSGVQRIQNRIQKICKLIFHSHSRQGRDRAHYPRVDSHIRIGFG